MKTPLISLTSTLLTQAYEALLSEKELEYFYHENALLVGKNRTSFLQEQQTWFSEHLKPKLARLDVHTQIYQPQAAIEPFYRVFQGEILLAEEQFSVLDGLIYQTQAPIDCFGKLIFTNRSDQPQRALTLSVEKDCVIHKILFHEHDIEDIEFFKGSSFEEDNFYSCTFNIEHDDFKTVIKKIRIDGSKNKVGFTYNFDIVCRGIDFPYFKSTQEPVVEGFLLHLRHKPDYYYSIKMKHGHEEYAQEYYTHDLLKLDSRLFLKKEVSQIDLIVDGPAFEYHLFPD